MTDKEVNIMSEIRRGDIWMVDFGVPEDENDHKLHGIRPVVIVSNDSANRHSTVFHAVPLTSKIHKKTYLPTHIFISSFKAVGLRTNSIAQCEQLCDVKDTDLIEKIGKVSKNQLRQITKGIGLLNRLDIDVLGTFRGMENGEWNRTQLLSTIGNNNWYAGYISVTAGISLAAAFMGKQQVRALGLLGSFLFFASAITSNSTTAILAACGLSLLLLLLSLRKRGRLLRALEILMLLPLSVFMVRMFLLLHLTGLVLAGDAEKRLFFTPAWYVVFVVEVAVYLILQLRERQERSDRLESGRVFRTVVGLAVTVTLAALLLGCLLVAGYLPGSDKVSEAANGRLALWKVTILTYGKEGLLFQIFGMGPDSFYYALYQWGSDTMDWINRGLLDNNIYSNAHNEWLTLLVQQGILGVIAYGGIFLTAFRNLRISATRDPRALAVFLGLTGYLICSLFTFQHVLSTPFAFALLGMAEGVLCKDVLNKS